jgi:hypothetical protein
MPKKKASTLDELIAEALKSLNQTISVDCAYMASAASETADGAQAFIYITPFNTNTVCYKVNRKGGKLNAHHSSTKGPNGWNENFRTASPVVDRACRQLALEHFQTM